MSEMLAMHFCRKCQVDRVHIFSGSGTKGVCMTCGFNLPEGESVDLKQVFCYE